MKKITLTLMSAASVLFTTNLTASQDVFKVGVVSLNSCAQDSKVGKKEQQNMESLKSQMQKQIQDIDKQLQDTSKKYQDPEYIDSISPDQEKALKEKIQTLNNELMKLQNQYYQVLQQANANLQQTVAASVQEASKYISKTEKLAIVMPKEATFVALDSLDVTQLVIEKMDELFEADLKSQEQQNEAIKPKK